ncbi:MAG: hypothetical protein MH321_06170 [Leptospiraceae bacterium]|nr:hypothetical protein [Leptospiraceae bacterium]
MDSISTFVCKSRFSTSVENLFQFHESSLGFDSLVGSVPGIEVLKKPKSLAVNEMAIMKIPIVPLVKVKWIAKHTLYEKNRIFQDIQVQGPFKVFIHSHKFQSEAENSILEDKIEFKAAFPFISKFIVAFLLRQQFKNRHKITAQALGVEFQTLACGLSKT